jgi:sulfonate transport system permease protein
MRKGAITLWRVALGLGLVGLWETAVAIGALDPFFVSRPSAIAQRVWMWVSTGFIWTHLSVTLQESILGLLIGAILGTICGFTLARATVAARVVEPYIMMLNAVPRVLLAPLFLLWFGLGIWSKVALAVTLVFFIMFFNAYQGVRHADPVLIENVRMLGASERQLVPTCARAERIDLDFLQPSGQPWFRHDRRRGRRVPGSDARAGLCDQSG